MLFIIQSIYSFIHSFLHSASKMLSLDINNRRASFLERRYIEQVLTNNNVIIRKVLVKDYDINNFECLIDGSLSKDPELISEAFNNYFTEIGPKLASKIKKRN